MAGRRHRAVSVLGAILVSVMLLGSTGCWGMMLHGRYPTERNAGDMDVGVIFLDIGAPPFGPGNFLIDLLAGTLRRPSDEQMARRGQASHQLFLNYKEPSSPPQFLSGQRVWSRDLAEISANR